MFSLKTQDSLNDLRDQFPTEFDASVMLTSTTIYSITCMKLVIYTTKVQCFFKRWNSPLPLNGDMPLYTKGNMYLNHFQLGNMHLKLQAQFFFFLGCISKISFKKDKEDRPCSAGCSIYKYKIFMRLVKDNCSSHCVTHGIRI